MEKLNLHVMGSTNARGLQLALGFALMLAFFANNAQAKIYKWVDENGITQYTQHPPPEDVQSQEIKTLKQGAEAAAQAQAALQKRVDALDERRSDKKLAAEEGEEAVAKRKEMKKYCNDTRARLSEFQSGRRLAEKQEDGSYVPVTEEQREEEIGRIQQQIKEQCG